MRKFILAIIYAYATSELSSISKRCLCLSYRTASTWGDYTILHSTVAHREHWCMIKCIHHPHCWAFNFLYDGTCELLPTLGDCEEPRSQPNSTFVHLSTCKGRTPVELPPRNWTENTCLTWIPHNKTLPVLPVSSWVLMVYIVCHWHPGKACTCRVGLGVHMASGSLPRTSKLNAVLTSM